MVDKIKLFMCSLSNKWCLITCLSEMALVLKTLVEILSSYFNVVKHDQKCPHKMIDCSGGTHWNFMQGLIKVASFI